MLTYGGVGVRQMLILADIGGRGVWTPHFWLTSYVNSPYPPAAAPGYGVFLLRAADAQLRVGGGVVLGRGLKEVKQVWVRVRVR